MKMRRIFIPVLVSACGFLQAADSGKTDNSSAPFDVQTAARVVQYAERDVVLVRTRVRFTTLVVLPKNEQIMDFVCGDKEFWVVNGAQNFAYVKPAKVG